jgi:WD domain, G-beta repeat
MVFLRSTPKKSAAMICLLSILSISGCGNAPPADAPKGTSGASAPAPANEAVSNPGKPESKELSSDATPLQNEQTGLPAQASTPLPATAAAKEKAALALAAQENNKLATPVVPTADQLARWKDSEFEPLQLLTRIVSEEIRFASHAESTSGSDWLALGGDKLTLWKPLANEPHTTLWDPRTTEKSEAIKSLAIDPTGAWIAAGDADGTLRIWNIADQKEVANKKILKNDITQIAISDDGKEIATASYGKEVSIWDSSSLQLVRKFEVDTQGLSRIVYVGPNKLAVAGQSLTIWDTEAKKLDKILLEKGYPSSMARSEDRSLFAFADENKLSLIRSSDMSVEAEVKGKFARNEILKFASDGKHLWTANGSNIRCWDRKTGKPLQFIDVTEPEVTGLDWLSQSSLLRVVTEDGAIRYWGTPAAGQAVGLKPVHAEIQIAESSKTPTTTFELQSIIDLRTFPQPPDSEAVGGESTMLQFETANAIDDTKSFYRYFFDKRGWKELPGNVHTPNYLTFEKRGYRVFINLSDSAGKTTVYMTNLGNLDMQTLPKLDFPDLKLMYEDASSVSYNLPAKLLEIEVALLKLFSSSGWTPYARLNSSHNEEANSRDLEFIRNGLTLRVGISPHATESNRYVVQYSSFVARGHLPFPPDCDYIECDASGRPALVVKTILTLDECQAFFDQSMNKLGWLTAGVVMSKDGEHRWLTYFHNQDDLRVSISKAEGGGTWVVVGEYARANSWQLAKQKDSSDAKSAKDPQKPGIEAADIPIYKQSEALSVKYDSKTKRIEIKVPKSSHIEIVDFYAAKLAETGWKEEKGGFRAEDYAFVTYTNDKSSVQVRVNSSPLETTIGISDDGLLWNKALPESKALISYESWLRKNGHPATLKLLNEYISAMQTQTAK